jgi:hypothetical protein
MSTKRHQNSALIAEVTALLEQIRTQHIKRTQEYPKLKEALRPRGFKPFDIFATYNYVAGSTKGDWEASVRLAAYVANRRG